MSRIHYTVVIFFIVVAVDKINSASFVYEKEIDNTLGDLQIRDETANGNSSLEARSRTKRWIDESVETPSESGESESRELESGESDSISYPDIQTYSRHSRGSGHSGGGHRHYSDDYQSHHSGGSHGYNNGGSLVYNSGGSHGYNSGGSQGYHSGGSQGYHSGGSQGYHSGGSHGYNSGGSHGYRSGGGHGYHTEHHGLHLAKVFMPTGEMASISVPKQLKGWKCGRPTIRKNLDPYGKIGHREYNLVANAVRATKIHTHFRDYRFIKIEKIINGCIWDRYRLSQKAIKMEVGFVNERMLFHGTSKVDDILKTGFDERFTKIDGNMFGAGIYFAEHSSKSNGYAFGNKKPCPAHKDIDCDKCERQMMLCRVTLGKMEKVTSAQAVAHPHPNFNSLKGVPSPGVLRYPEYIVYRGEQIYPEYVITYKIVK